MLVQKKDVGCGRRRREETSVKLDVLVLLLSQSNDLVASSSPHFGIIIITRYALPRPINTPEVRGRTKSLAGNTANKNICWEYLDTAHVATNGHGRPC